MKVVHLRQLIMGVPAEAKAFVFVGPDVVAPIDKVEFELAEDGSVTGVYIMSSAKEDE